MRITKVYTKTGDAGQTRLAGGQQVWKDSLRVEAYGTVDELNASVGVVRVINAEQTLRCRKHLSDGTWTNLQEHAAGDGERCHAVGKADRSLSRRP